MNIARIDSIVQKECGIDKRRALLVGVSGGPDSLCLMGVLGELGYPLVLAHFDHRLRPESAADAEAVRRAAAARGLPVVIGAGDVRELARVESRSLEEAARVARYRFLFQAAREAGAQAVAVAHTADDQVETVLMHLLRGSGLAGLKGMLPCSPLPEFDPAIPIVRPLLSVWREETLGYCREMGFQPVFDATNADTTFFRNRLRHELIPYLQSYNPQAKPGVLRMAEVLAGDYALIQEDARRALVSVLHERGEGYLAFDLSALRALPQGLIRAVVRQAVGELRPGLRDVDFAAVERALEFIQSPPLTRHMDLIDRLELESEQGSLWLHEPGVRLPHLDWPWLPPEAELTLPVPGEIRLVGGWRITAEFAPANPPGKPDWEAVNDPDQAWLDAERLTPPGQGLWVRARRPGDRFLPIGLGGHAVKLSDYFVNVKMPRRAREGWPLVFAGAELAWVPGYRSSEALRVGTETGRVIHLRLERNNGT